MGEYHVRGGKALRGRLEIGGAKNAVLPILASTVLNGGKSVIHNCPEISDTYLTMEILNALGCATSYADATICVDSSAMTGCAVPDALVRQMRSSIIFMGSLLGRFGEVAISYPGGCELGSRPIDFHIKALRRMGAEITEEHGSIMCRTAGLSGKKITLDLPSVGATENIMLAAVLSKGETVILNAAREPEICDLQSFLNAMGGKVKGAGTGKIVISGVEKLDNAEHTIIPDRIVAGTYLTAAAMTGGEAILDNIVLEHISPIYSRLMEAGCAIREDKTSIYVRAPKRLSSIDRLTTLPHPGFPTDMQPQLVAMLCVARGSSIINETMFESRNKHVSELCRMGADIILLQNGTTAFVRGVKALNGAVVEAKDLRGGAALILAGLAAEGETVVLDSRHIERGYERIEEKLRNLGADIELVK